MHPITTKSALDLTSSTSPTRPMLRVCVCEVFFATRGRAVGDADFPWNASCYRVMLHSAASAAAACVAYVVACKLYNHAVPKERQLDDNTIARTLLLGLLVGVAVTRGQALLQTMPVPFQPQPASTPSTPGGPRRLVQLVRPPPAAPAAQLRVENRDGRHAAHVRQPRTADPRTGGAPGSRSIDGSCCSAARPARARVKSGGRTWPRWAARRRARSAGGTDAHARPSRVARVRRGDRPRRAAPLVVDGARRRAPAHRRTRRQRESILFSTVQRRYDARQTSADWRPAMWDGLFALASHMPHARHSDDDVALAPSAVGAAWQNWWSHLLTTAAVLPESDEKLLLTASAAADHRTGVRDRATLFAWLHRLRTELRRRRGLPSVTLRTVRSRHIPRARRIK